MSVTLRSRRGPIGKAWQAVALRGAVETLLGAGRASGGRADARAGRVQWLDVTAGRARGAVLDADGTVYEAQLDLSPLSGADRGVVLRIARSHPELPARLAGGDYPEQIERELAREEVSLLPRGASELSHDCSCLDWPGPCRHVAALSYVLVEEVDVRPATLLTWRGLELGELVATPAAQEEQDEAGPPPGTGAVDPRRLDPATLAAVVGEYPAGVIARFFAAAEQAAEQEPRAPTVEP